MKRGGKNIPIYRSFLFFLIRLLTAILEKNRQEKQAIKKKTYLSFLSVFLICLATATLEKNKQEKHTYLSFLWVFSHLPCYGYTGEKHTMQLFIFLVCFFSSAFLQLHWREIEKKNRYWWEKPTRKKDVGLKI